MFTGIITHLGKVRSKAEDSFVLEADISLVRKLEKGISISVNGVCLTVLEKPVEENFTVEVMPETWKRSMLGKLIKGDVVNLELPVTTKSLLAGSPDRYYMEGGERKKIEVKDRGLRTIEKLQIIPQTKNVSVKSLTLSPEAESFLSGHLVQGHIDGVGIIKKIIEEGNSRILTIEIPKNINRYIVEKGFIAVSGISLTVIEVTDSWFSVGIIPFTWENTMLHILQEGNSVNIEIDILAKYIEKMFKEVNK